MARETFFHSHPVECWAVVSKYNLAKLLLKLKCFSLISSASILCGVKLHEPRLIAFER